MCGIVGLINGEFAYQQDTGKVLSDMLFLDTLRGADSTGVAFIPKKIGENFDIIKRMVPGYDFVEMQQYLTKTYNMEKYGAVIGHNRLATKGGKKVANAHPFMAENAEGAVTILAHNGTLHDHHKLPNGKDYMTDSEAIANLIANIGIEETVKQLDGSFALAWFDDKTSTMNFIRNDKRPFAIAYDKTYNITYFASEANMIYTAVLRRGRSIGECFYAEPDTLYTFDMTKPKEILEKKKLEMFKLPSYSSYPPIKKDHSLWPYNDAWDDDYKGGAHNGQGKFLEKTKKTFTETDKKEKKITELKRLFDNKYKGKTVEISIVDVVPYSTGRLQLRGILGDIGFPTVLVSIPIEDEKKYADIDELTVFIQGWMPVFSKHNGNEAEEIQLIARIVEGAADEYSKSTLYKGPKGSLLTKDDWFDLTAGGCKICRTVLALKDHKEMTWSVIDGQPLCPKCSKDTDLDEGKKAVH